MSGLDFTVYKGSEEGKVVKSQSHRGNLKPDEVLLKITHAGLCGTDQHFKSIDMVLGHEGVGIVQQVGANVLAFKVGDRAGWGYLHDACLHCDQCLSGNEIHCSERAMYGVDDKDQGAFASHAIWKASFLFHIPDAIPSEEAAPLMCAGATVFNALYLGNVHPTDRVGVLGIGGLGHLAIQFASKMGCEVVVFSGTDSKKEEAKKLGASEFYATKGLQTLDIGRPVDHLLVTTSSQPDWNLFLPVVARRGTIFPLSVSENDLVLPYMTIVSNGIRVHGIICPSRGVHVKMLRFAAFHGIKPMVQQFEMSVEGIEDAMAKLDKGQQHSKSSQINVTSYSYSYGFSAWFSDIMAPRQILCNKFATDCTAGEHLKAAYLFAINIGRNSTIHDNGPELLEREKRRNLSGGKPEPIENAPGWNEDLATASEAFVKADRTNASIHDLQEKTINHVQSRNDPDERLETREAPYVRDQVDGPLGSARVGEFEGVVGNGDLGLDDVDTESDGRTVTRRVLHEATTVTKERKPKASEIGAPGNKK
ncbi:hypothetical protein BS17DRAFT_817325 [Gyrodon lividus]|nr:hypothetical protein BS17DRAFT_817325 [Gyrodon lividus]